MVGELRCTLKQAQDGVAVPLDESTTVVVVPAVAQITLKGRAFDAGRSFVLPRALDALNEVFAFATRMQAKHAVVVDHVESFDEQLDALSEARAKVAAAWLAGDPATWVDQYADSVPEALRWGPREDQHMLSVVMGGAAGASKPGETGDPLVRAFQTLAGVKVDGIAGPVTRGKLVEKYFALSRQARLNGAEPPENGVMLLDTKVASLAASAHFTLQQVFDAKKAAQEAEADAAPESSTRPTKTPAKATESEADSGSETDTKAQAPQEAEARVDFMFFFAEAGPDPAPGAPDGPEFLEWVKQAELQRVVSVAGSSGNTLLLELWDKPMSTRHKGAKYTLTGPQTFTGVTTSQGRIEHDDVLPGDYTLKLTLEFFTGADKITDEYEAAVVVLDGDGSPQVRALGAVPRCELVQLNGLLFETNKAFVVPEAVNSLKDIRSIYEQHNGYQLLVVGHTDTTGTPNTNDPLSLDRARAMLAYLQDDVDTWLSFYGAGVKAEHRWGVHEDERMQELVNDPSLSRKELIAAYMRLDGAELDSGEFDIEATAHGCGENFPLNDAGDGLDDNPANNKEDALDRRVELFFFDPEFGVVPKPSGQNSKKGSTQYPEWRKHSKLIKREEVGASGLCHLCYLVQDAKGQPVSETDFTVELPTGQCTGRTSGEGLLRVTGLDPDEYSILLGGIQFTAPAFDRNSAPRSLQIFGATNESPGSVLASNQVSIQLLDDAGSPVERERIGVIRADGSEEEHELEHGVLVLTIEADEEIQVFFPDRGDGSVGFRD